MKIVVSGGSGFIGRHLTSLLIENKHRVLVLGRRSYPVVELEGLSFLACDLNNLSSQAVTSIEEFCPDAGVHLAWHGIPDYSPETCRKNFDASINFFELLLKSGCKKLLGAGSCWEYGELRGAVSEKQQAKELGAFAAYKTAARLVLESLCRPAAAQAIWARVFFVYGEGQREEALIPSTMRKIRSGVPIEIRSPNAQNDFIYVGDVARAIMALLESDTAFGPYNVGSGRPFRVGDLVQEVGKSLGQQKNLFAFEKKDNPEESFWADISRIQAETGWHPKTDLEAGLAKLSAVSAKS